MSLLDNFREFFGLEPRRIHPKWIELFRTIASDGSQETRLKLDPEALLVSLSRGYVRFDDDTLVLTEKGRRQLRGTSKR